MGVGPLLAQGSADPGDVQPPRFLPRLEWELTAHFNWVDGRVATGTYRSGNRIHNEIAGGEFRGPRLRGRILPGGGDWATMTPATEEFGKPAGPNRFIAFDARYIFETDDGESIYVVNVGGLGAGPEAQAERRVPKGGPVYAVSQPRFDVRTDSRYAFLGRNIFVAFSVGRPADTMMHVFRATLGG